MANFLLPRNYHQCKKEVHIKAQPEKTADKTPPVGKTYFR